MADETLVQKTVDSVNKGLVSYCKFITANDAGVTGAHQSGFHIHKSSYSLFFDKEGQKGANKDKFIKIKWQNDFETDSRFIYYGTGTRNEYRLTRFGRGFPFLTEDNVGNLLIITKQDDSYYDAYVLSTDNEIEDFLNTFGLSPVETNTIISKSNIVAIEAQLESLFQKFISKLEIDFPSTSVIADSARKIIIEATGSNDKIIKKYPDREILKWLNTEYKLFKTLENDRYSDFLSKPFKSIDDFIKIANTVLNRRKSRAGKSLEHHLGKMFSIFDLRYVEQPKTEGNKKPDFIFPSEKDYHNPKFTNKNLVFLGAKTTCKDRWRQILNEADRINIKHLFTLQQGVSSNQLKEMYDHNVKLVVPKPYINSYPKEYRKEIYSLNNFVHFVKTIQQK